MEIAKLRAARLLWARADAAIRPKEPGEPGAAHALPDLRRQPDRAGSATTTSSAPPSRRWRRCSAARSRCTPTRSTRRIALPTRFSARIARNTQLILAEETGITACRRSAGRQLLRRSLTHAIAGRARRGADRRGRGTRRHDQGRREPACPSCTSRKSAARRQARIDRGEEVIVGVNKYQSDEDGACRHPRRRQRRGARPRRSRGSTASARSRDKAQVAGGACRADRGGEERRGQSAGAGDRGDARARHGRRNLRCAGRGVRPPPAPRSAIGHRRLWRAVSGRRGLQPHPARDRGLRPRAKAAARACWSPSWARTGTTAAPRSSPPPLPISASMSMSARCSRRPEEAARQAIENDVHVVGVSSQAAGHKTLVPALIEALKQGGRRRHPGRLRRRHPAAGLRFPAARPASPRSSAPAPTSRPPPAKSSP